MPDKDEVTIKGSKSKAEATPSVLAPEVEGAKDETKLPEAATEQKPQEAVSEKKPEESSVEPAEEAVGDKPTEVVSEPEKSASVPEVEMLVPTTEEKVEPIDVNAPMQSSSDEVKSSEVGEKEEVKEEAADSQQVTTESASSLDIPSVDPNASLKIDSLKRPEVPGVDINAPLKIDDKDNVSEESKLDKENKKVFILGVVITSIIVLAAGAILFMYFSKPPAKEEQSIQETSEEAPKEVKKEAPVIDRAQWKLEVLNGSGVAGAAKETADTLSELGYIIEKTGNADKDDYEKAQLFVAADKTEEEREAILTDMKKEIGITEIAGDLEDSEADARIVIGKE